MRGFGALGVFGGALMIEASLCHASPDKALYGLLGGIMYLLVGLWLTVKEEE